MSSPLTLTILGEPEEVPKEVGEGERERLWSELPTASFGLILEGKEEEEKW